MSKTFSIEPGYEVRKGHVWYDSRVLLIVEDDEWVDVFTLVGDERAGSPIGSYTYNELDVDAPPRGLRR